MPHKTPEQFNVGDKIKHSPTTPYSGSLVVKVEGLGESQIQVTFANGEVVEFFSGIQHEMEQ